MTYPEPVSKFQDISLGESHSQTAVVITKEGIPVEISSFTDIGWEIEVRYDKNNDDFNRQPYTGAQEKLTRDNLRLELKEQIEITNKTSSVHINPKDGKISIFDSGGKTLFQTLPFPFSYHPQNVSIYEKIMSLKVTDFSERAPFSPKGELFETHMVRFQYPRPTGTVLGIPGQSGESNRNGYRFELYNADEYLHLPMRTPMYQSWPIIFHKNPDNSHWLCIFHDNPSRTFIDIGDFYEDRVTFESLIGNTRIYILSGNTLEEVSHKLATLLGGSQLPPLWAFGYQQCRFSYMSTHEVQNVALSMEKENVPLDAIYCDIDIFDGFRVFTKNKQTFGDFPEVSKKLKEKDIHTITIMDPGVKVDDAYPIYNELKSSSGYLKNLDNSAFIAKVWPGSCLFPDFSLENVRTWWAEHQQQWIKENELSGIWNDMNEPSNFDGMQKKTSKTIWSHGAFQNEYNLYGYYMSMASAQGWNTTYPKERGLIITRSGYPGVQQHAVIWHGDNFAWWEHLRLALYTTIAYSLCGAYYTGADVPGFTGNPPDDLAVRFFQLGSMLPLFRGHSIFFAKNKEPYAFGAEARENIRSAIHLRYSLLREWYSSFEFSVRTNQPLLTPVFDTKQEYIPDQFMLFNKLLVAPIVQRDEHKKLVYLPPGLWYHLNDKQTVLTGDQWLAVDISLSTMPVFVKGGTILTRNTVGKNTRDTLQKKEWYEVYKDAHGTAKGYWYNDDGKTLNDPHAERYLLDYLDGEVKKTEM